jgi:CBS-domain-containing membrane protein
MRVDQIMTRQVGTCQPEDSLERAAQLMWSHDCGCVPVVSGDGTTRIEGLITDRDICMCALFEGKPLHELQVAQAMTRQVRACKASDSLGVAERVMADARVRRLPVLDEQSALIGMVSLADLAREASRETTSPQQQIMESEVGDTLAAICRTVSGAPAS